MVTNNSAESSWKSVVSVLSNGEVLAKSCSTSSSRFWSNFANEAKLEGAAILPFSKTRLVWGAGREEPGKRQKEQV